jgi:hypothetical protein
MDGLRRIKGENKMERMNKEEFDKYMCIKYPDIFKMRNALPMETGMCWGFCIDGGWYDLVDKLCEDFSAIQRATGIMITATQVKEKFGGLRFYIDIDYNSDDKEFCNSWYRIIYDRIYEAEKESFRTCEKCGSYGQIRSGRWIRTLCDECNEKKNEKINELC